MQFFDGGAFADCPYIQYPHGLGTQRAPASVLAAAAAAAAPSQPLATSPLERFKAAVPAITAGAASRAYLATAAARSTTTTTNTVPSTPSSGGSLHSQALALVPSTATSSLVGSASTGSPRTVQNSGETAEETTARTAKQLQDTLQAARQTQEVFDGRSLALQSRQRAAAAHRPNAASTALAIVVGDADGARESDPGPIVRSPTKEKKNKFTDAILLRSAGGKKKNSEAESAATGSADAVGPLTGSSSSSAMVAADGAVAAGSGGSTGQGGANRKVVVPFCVSNWQNRKKIIVPVEQRLAQQHDDRLDDESGMGDAIMDLAVAMQQASKEVAAEMAAKEKAKAEEEERQQAALEAAEAEKARQLLEKKAAELAANAQRRETREQRLERIKLERELREQEKLAKQEQRLRERAAARLNISVEDLEADEKLLKTVEEASVHVGLTPSAPTVKVEPSASSSVLGNSAHGLAATSAGVEREEEEDGEGNGGPRKPAVRGGIFASAVISNEGIQREMQALADVEAAEKAGAAPQHDGIRLRENDEDEANSADEDADAEANDFQLHKFVKKKPRL